MDPLSWVLVGVAGLAFVGVQVSPLLKAARWWPWKGNRKGG